MKKMSKVLVMVLIMLVIGGSLAMAEENNEEKVLEPEVQLLVDRFGTPEMNDDKSGIELDQTNLFLKSQDENGNWSYRLFASLREYPVVAKTKPILKQLGIDLKVVIPKLFKEYERIEEFALIVKFPMQDGSWAKGISCTISRQTVGALNWDKMLFENVIPSMDEVKYATWFKGE